MSTIRILLVCRDGISRQKYLDACNGLEVSIDIASSYQELLDSAVKNQYNGLMLDIPTKVKNLSRNKESASRIIESFPTLQLTYNEKSGQTRAYYSGKIKGNGTIEDFITKKCTSFDARATRTERRKDMVFNAILSKNKDISDGNCKKTVTINVSKGGCFVFSVDNWKVNSDAYLIIKELTDQTPIRGEVRRRVDWGKHMCVPGIGILFKDIKETQLDEFCTKCCL